MLDKNTDKKLGKLFTRIKLFMPILIIGGIIILVHEILDGFYVYVPFIYYAGIVSYFVVGLGVAILLFDLVRMNKKLSKIQNDLKREEEAKKNPGR
ncbi:hypothetical protein SFC66_13295 [Terribacillus saccharophilus]|uniref:hypothetical protein n=1 Tax=Terribacillus saccharophilus TaxID=361277 RepID=UPI0039827629